MEEMKENGHTQTPNGENLEEKKENGQSQTTKGGLRTMPPIFANEICEKLAVVGFHTNMLSYLTRELHLPLTKAANTLTNFNGTAALMPLLGAFIADAYAGRFWTITVASLVYQMGMISLILSAVLPTLRPPPCKGSEVCEEAAEWQLAILYASLLLTAIGSGGIRPCVVAFGADQFDETDPNEKTRIYNFFNWYYFCMGVAFLVAVTVVVYIQENIGWGWGLGIPAIAMAISIVTFVLGFPLYRNFPPCGSPFTRLAQVVVAAFRKRNLSMVSDPRLLYENGELDAPISANGMLLHTTQMKFFDKAAIVTEEDGVRWPSTSSEKPPNLWNLCTVHRVEELKSVIRMGPIWASAILLMTASAQQNTFSQQQARTMNRHLTHSFQIPPGSMSVFSYLSMLITISLYDRILIPVARRFTGLDRGITFLQRIGVGLAVSVFATLAAGFVEGRRKHAAAVHGLLDSRTDTIPISVFWLVPQYALHGIAEAFTSIGHLEFFYDQAPESMRSTATALFWGAISAGSYVSTFLVTIIHHASDWLPDDHFNRGKLDYFYWLITLLQMLNLGCYLVCASFYTLKPVQQRPKVASVELSSPV